MQIGKSFLVQHFMDTLWLIEPAKLKNMTEVLVSKLANSGSIELFQGNDTSNIINGVQRIGNIAILNIEGTLVPKASNLDAMCGFVSTIKLHDTFNQLVEDSSIKRIVLYFDSPGGSSIAIPEFAESIYNARSKKEIVAFTDVYACSGAFWLASAAEKFVVTPSSIIGSIGAYVALIKEKKEGVAVHFIQAGENKTFGSPQTEISESEIAYFQERIDSLYVNFVSAIVKHRNVSEEDVKNTKGSFYNSADAPEWMRDAIADSNYILS